MSVRIADQNAVVYKVESGTYATASGNGHWLGLVTEHSATDNENVMLVRYAGTNSRNVSQEINGAKDYEGAITMHPQDMRMIAYTLGSVIDSGSPSPYAHSILELNSGSAWGFVTNSNFPSFTIVDSAKGKADGEHQVRTYGGCKINSLTWTSAQGEADVVELNWIGQSLTIGSKTSDIPTITDEDTSRPFIWSDSKFHLPSGTVVNECTNVAVTINNNLERRHYVNGSKVIQDLVALNRDYTINLTIDSNTTHGMTLYNNFQNGTAFNCMIERVISTGSEQGFMVFSGCKITEFESPLPAEGINEYTVTITPQSCNVNVDDLIEKFNPW